MGDYCPICGDYLAGEAHDCAAAKPKWPRAIPRIPLGAVPGYVRAEVRVAPREGPSGSKPEAQGGKKARR